MQLLIIAINSPYQQFQSAISLGRFIVLFVVARIGIFYYLIISINLFIVRVIGFIYSYWTVTRVSHKKKTYYIRYNINSGQTKGRKGTIH